MDYIVTPIRDLDTGKIYNSVSDCVYDMGIINYKTKLFKNRLQFKAALREDEEFTAPKRTHKKGRPAKRITQ